MKLEELQVYSLSMEMGEEIWVIVKEWDYFVRDTVGKQLVRAVDSIAANLSEANYAPNEMRCKLQPITAKQITSVYPQDIISWSN